MTDRIGIFGGTFDPPHTGHVVIAAQSVATLALDRLLVVVANDPWQKRGAVVAKADDRLALALAAFEGMEHIEVSDIEIRRGGPTYTIETVEAFDVPGREVFVIVGADAARGLPTWHRAADLARLATIGVVAREGATVEPIPGFRSVKIEVDRVDASSSEVRERIARGEPIDGLVPPKVIRELRARRLYTSM